MFTDSHCHLLNEYYDDLDSIIEEANENMINRYITSGYDLLSNIETVNISQSHKNVYGTIGIHPNNIEEITEEWFVFLINNFNKKNIVAIGEIGLDYHYEKINKDIQIKWFNKQLKFAEEHNLPVVIHSREATEDTINCIKKHNVKGVIHSFGGSYETANIYIKMGFVLGINGTITFKNSNLKDIIKKIGVENIIIETDCPFLTPEPYRGKKNFPKHILDIAKFISKNNDITLEQLSKITNNNIKRIFDI